jgi:serine/threonine-protein kinase RsbT
MVDLTNMPITSDVDIFFARQKGRALANELGFSPVEATLLATTISELARDILLHANSGEITLKPIPQGHRVGIRVTAAYDKGPVILATPSVAPPGNSNSSWSPFVLQQVRYLVDEMEYGPLSGESATITAVKWRQ